MHCSLALALLAALASLAAAQSTSPSLDYIFRYNTDFMNKDNWVDGELPQAGQTVVFPNSFSDFGSSRCTSTHNCKRGAASIIKSPVEGRPAEVRMKSLIIPNGKVQFAGNTRIIFNRQKMKASVKDAAQFNNHGPQAQDFTCANNWLLASSMSNPDQTIPSVRDVAKFTPAHLHTVTVPANVHVSALRSMTGFVSDRRQYVGEPISFAAGTCENPLGSDRNESHCVFWTHNTCSNLNPDRKAAATANIVHINRLLSYINQALNLTTEKLTAQQQLVQVNGAIGFTLPEETSLASATAVHHLIQTELPKLAAFAINFTCVEPEGPVISCAVAANITASRKNLLTSRLAAPHVFIPGILSSLFANQVTLWARNETTHAYMAQLQLFQKNGFFTIGLEISQRFFNDMGVAITSISTIAYLAVSFGVEPEDISPLQVIPASSLAGVWTLVFSVANKRGAGPTESDIVRVMTATSDVLTFPVGSSDVPLYVKSDIIVPRLAAPVVVKTVIDNSELASALPLTGSALTSAVNAVRSRIDGLSSLGEDVLDISFEPFVSQTGARRSADQVVVITVLVAGSQLIDLSTATLLDGMLYGTTPSIGISSKSFTLQKAQEDDISLAIIDATLRAALASSNANDDSESLSSFGTTTAGLAVASYSWSDLGTSDENSALPFLTNEQCNIVSSYSSDPATFASAVAAELAKVMPIALKAITVSGAATCGPANPLQRRGDQRAVYSMDVTLAGQYSLFASDAAYVAFPPSVVPSLMSPEASAPLNQKTVRSLVENAIRRAFLVAYKSAQQQELIREQNVLTTRAPATTVSAESSAASSLGLFAGAGGGFIVILLVVIVVIVVVRRRRSAPAPASQKTRGKSVVAFENPMYASPSESQPTYDNNGNDAANPSEGLYDEPAFINKSDKENPLYESTENLLGDKNTQDEPQHTYGYSESEFDQTAVALQSFAAEQDFHAEDAGYLDVADS